MRQEVFILEVLVSYECSSPEICLVVANTEVDTVTHALPGLAHTVREDSRLYKIILSPLHTTDLS